MFCFQENVKNNYCVFASSMPQQMSRENGDRHRAAVWRTEFPSGFLGLCEAHQKQLRVDDFKFHRNSRGPLFFESSFVSHSMQRGPERTRLGPGPTAAARPATLLVQLTGRTPAASLLPGPSFWFNHDGGPQPTLKLCGHCTARCH